MAAEREYDLEAVKVLLQASGLSQVQAVRGIGRMIGDMLSSKCQAGCEEGCNQSCSPGCNSGSDGGRFVVGWMDPIRRIAGGEG
jgi:hypothetical protein